MCTLLVLRRPDHAWPLLLAANRDEMRDRPWQPPGRHWRDRPHVVAGLDELSGGAWLGLNEAGLLAAVLNRPGTLGPAAGKRSRGELVLEALDHSEAEPAAEALSHLDPNAYRGFNLVISDTRQGFWLRHKGEGARGIEIFPLPEGLSMVTAHDLNDRESPRIRTFLPRFETARAPDPEGGDWSEWQALLASRESSDGPGPESAMTVALPSGFETVSSSLIALPAPPRHAGEPSRRPLWLFAPGRPDRTSFQPVELT